MSPEETILSDSELVANVERGEEPAAASLYEKYSERVFFLALSERHSREDAEDIRAETFVRVLQAIRESKLRKPGSLSSFIVGIALNVMREHTRQRAGIESLTDREAEFPGETSPEWDLRDKEIARSIRETASYLKPREQDFLRMYYYEELSKEEIARALGIKQERLRLIKSRALKRFRDIYEKPGNK